MELTNEFTVPVPVERAWELLTDVELIAPCLPGAQLQEVEGDEYRGVVKVKVGPITAQYKGAATFREQDLENRKIVLEAEGRDTRGQGSASAVITATMTESGSGDGVSTHVVVDSDVTIKGKVAQFGRGMIAEVSAKLLTQFVECLEGKLDAEPTKPAGGSDEDVEDDVDTAATAVQGGGALAKGTMGNPAAEAAKDAAKSSDSGSRDGSDSINGKVGGAAKSAVRKIEQAANDPVDLLDAAGSSVVKRAAPIAGVLFVLLIIGRWRAKRR